MKKDSGLTLIELMVTSAILAIGVLAAFGSFRYIATSIQHSKGRSLANNLATEQIEKLKNLSYYSLLVTTATYTTDTRFSPALVYDQNSYPPQAVSQGGISFLRGTRVDFAYQYGTSITTTSWTSNDTGLKLISVYVIWRDEASLRYVEIHNLMANPAANPLNSMFSGTVLSTGGVAIAGAMVKTIDNPNYYAMTNGAGQFQISVSSGNYTLYCSSQGYYSADRSLVAQSGVTTPASFTLSHMAPGIASGYAYLNDHLVVSQVVVSTDTNVEYVELYNPTTGPVDIGSVWPTRTVDLYIFDSNNITQPTSGLQPVPLVYVSTYIASNKYYLIANTPNPIHVAGQTRQADAYYQAAYQGTHLFEQDVYPQGKAGGTGIATVVGGVRKIDSVAWDHTLPGECPSTPMEGNCYDFTMTGHGLAAGEILIRLPNPGTPNWSYGRAYDADNNNTDFSYQTTIPAAPNSMSQAAAVPISGTPAVGAYVTANDPLSSPVTVDSTGRFTLPSIATGTWTLAIASGSYYYQMGNMQISASVSTTVPNAITTPAWPAATYNNALLSNTTTCAFVSGVVTDASNIPLPGIQVNAGGTVVPTGSTGRYFAATSTGDVLIIANYNNQDRGHASQSSIVYGTTEGRFDNPLGVSDSTWFQLPLSGTLVGYFQNASGTALPGQTAVAISGGNLSFQAVSDNTGHFYLRDLSTGTYTITPALDPMSSVSPTAAVVTLASTGTATSVSTFTVATGLAQITGQVSIGANNEPITTGVLIMASSATITGALPPTLDGGLGTLCAPCYYGGSSDASGSYTLYVRSSTTPYQLYGWYTHTFGVSSSSTTKRGPYSLTVNMAGTTVTQNLAW